jgi:hypothetical protein
MRGVSTRLEIIGTLTGGPYRLWEIWRIVATKVVVGVRRLGLIGGNRDGDKTFTLGVVVSTACVDENNRTRQGLIIKKKLTVRRSSRLATVVGLGAKVTVVVTETVGVGEPIDLKKSCIGLRVNIIS